ncbi:uncharacterized protein LOC101893978 [Musca domestica]|uniref:Uncharacterized protein LOC101893978 n=1 Tax=Musca domestica TaxID=7370 RepID=A0A9J7CS53_MUSDO|nr:uncharacterized protein LOC101893978 [Musca domestica]
MSQEKDTNKYSPNNNHCYKNNKNNNHHHNNNSNNHNTMKYENKRSSVPKAAAATALGCDGASTTALYENFMAPHQRENVIAPANNNNQIYSYLAAAAVENNSNQTSPFNGAQQFVYETSTQLNGKFSVSSTTSSSVDDKDKEKRNYENIDFGDRQYLDGNRKVLLQKYFRTALVGPRDNIYENLCRGCNYGVFSARGPLCSFCECIVNGVQSLGPTPVESTNNIYENICEYCSQFYSGNDAEDCACRKHKQLELTFSFREEESEEIEVKEENKQKYLKKSGSEDCLIKCEEEEKKPQKQVKIRKSQSFNKSVKPKRLASFWESLRKNRSSDLKTKKSPAAALEIVHNVEGYDQVFHTKDTFDLQRICELKRSATSCSDQHIYGRLKNRDLELLKSQEEFLSTQSLSQHEKGPKKKRISKAKFLRSASSNVDQEESQYSIETLAAPTANNSSLQSVYLNASICQWLASLRHHHHHHQYVNNQLNGVNSWLLALGIEDFDECLCYPKSIPAKRRYQLGATFTTHTSKHLQISQNVLMTNKSNIRAHKDLTDSTEIVTLRRGGGGVGGISSTESLASVDVDYLPTNNEEDHYRQMVEEFMWHLINKQVKRQPYQEQQQQKPFNTMASGGNRTHNDIPLRQANTNHNKAKRQGMYLRLEETPNLQAAAAEATPINNNENLPVLPKESITALGKEKLYSSKGELTETNRNEPRHDFGKERVDVEITDSLRDGEIKEENEKPHSKEELTEGNRNEQSKNSFKEELIPDNRNEQRNSKERIKGPINNSLKNIEIEEINNSSIESTAHIEESLKLNARNLENKRGGIHERNVLKAFEALLRQEQQQQQHHHHYTKQTHAIDDDEKETEAKESQLITSTYVPEVATFAINAVHANKQTDEQLPIFDFYNLIQSLQLSASLNTIALHYSYNERVLWVFLVKVSQAGEKYKHLSHEQMVRKYLRFLRYLSVVVHSSQNKQRSLWSIDDDHSSTIVAPPPLKHSVVAETSSGSVDLKLDLMKTNGSLYGRIIVRKTNDSLLSNGKNDNEMQMTSSQSLINSEINNNNNNNNIKKTRKSPPAVPKRSPHTKLSPSTEQLPPIPGQRNKMTKPPAQLCEETRNSNQASAAELKEEEESIYQPIWKFKTVGEVEEHFRSDEDYYSLEELKKQGQSDSIPDICITEQDEDDHSEWEPDEEFIFTTTNSTSNNNSNDKHDSDRNIPSITSIKRTESLSSQDRNSTIRSNRSLDSTLGSTSLSGSTITDFASSTATLASNVSSSLVHHMFRNIGIFYSLTEPKLRAIIYDYDRIHATKYFAKSPIIADDSNDSGLGKSPTPSVRQIQQQQHSMRGSPILQKQSQQQQQQRLQYGGKPNKCISSSESVAENNDTMRSSPSSAGSAKVLAGPNLSPPNTRNSPNTDNNNGSSSSIAGDPAACNLSSVLAWKQQLLNVNYMEDEEDMIVSESEILRAQMIKEDVQPQQFTQRYKSRSTENFLELPAEDDEKKTIADRVRSRLQRGILNINSKVSPKSEKKIYKGQRNAQTTSLYLEDGLKPKYPIFGTPLDQLELNRTTCPNVPRFVVDSIEYIERNDRIVQDGLYRACGNKYIIDELKQKLSKSYIYDPKLITADDIHTVTSLLKQFFRDLPQPLIPQETYNCLARDLLKSSENSNDTFRIAINEMPEPNKSTLAFLIKHLTNVAACSASNRMTASNLAIVWGPSLFTLNEANTYDIGRMNTIAKMLIENFDRIFYTNERLL